MLGWYFAVITTIIIVAAGWRRHNKPNGELESCYDSSDGERRPHGWGYTDTQFEFDGPRSVRVTGDRYPLAGPSLPGFLPFVEAAIGLPIREQDMVPINRDLVVNEPNLNQAFVTALEARLDPSCLSRDDSDRLVHSHGQLSVDEVYRVLYGAPLERTVDLVVRPASEDDVRALVELATTHNVCLVPYGGGTNVSGALTCPVDEPRMIVSVDMREMKRILWLDEDNNLACIEAGISGKDLERELDARGFTTGHDPDSIELSTLGGWISTNASGMKKNKYGNIEDIVLEATLVGAGGEITTNLITPRNSLGVTPRALLFGSEGSFGIITKAVLKIHRRPQVREYGSLVFPSFENGVRYLKELRATGVLPASIRLVNNTEFRFGQALKPAPTPIKGMFHRVQRWFLLSVKGFEPMKMAACTIVMEGSRDEVRHQRRTIFGLVGKHGGVSGGAQNGKRGYMLTFGIAYIRDFFNRFQILGETFETSVTWDKILPVCRAVEIELAEQCKKHGVAGNPYLSYRVTQTYHSGACIYFTMGLSGKGLAEPEHTYHQVESRLRQVILDNGGSPSHHHGIGKIRRRFLPQIQSQAAIELIRSVKQAVDPGNVFGAGNGVFADLDATADGVGADSADAER